ncbi:hypothetical protein [Amycolatopsis sp. La24]|uniref:hypothetical protein n=1 Tax=Amycolatopsis sp. La24 TaxID=3028304 RepID=UPI0023B080CA|nr:hypothetical protein [Amycolatopsis sp. La24]
MHRLLAMDGLGVPVLLGASRESFIGEAASRKVEDRHPALLALIVRPSRGC